MARQATKRVRHTYTSEFKRNAVELTTDKGMTLAEAAAHLGIRANLISRWKAEMGLTRRHPKAPAAGPMRGGGKETAAAPTASAAGTRVERLERELAALRQEHGLLQSTTAVIASSQRLILEQLERLNQKAPA